ncbi:hypothetical protein ACKWTF_003618 [Chironomus riparius]
MPCIANYIVNIALIILMTNCASSKNVATLSNEHNRDLLKLSEISNKTINDTSVIPRKSEARETRWSYYNVASTLWHFPLFFMVYFVWYLAFCTVRSIYNHQINPDDYLRKRRSVDDWNMNQLTQYVLNAVESFPNKILRSY